MEARAARDEPDFSDNTGISVGSEGFGFESSLGAMRTEADNGYYAYGFALGCLRRCDVRYYEFEVSRGVGSLLGIAGLTLGAGHRFEGDGIVVQTTLSAIINPVIPFVRLHDGVFEYGVMLKVPLLIFLTN